MASYAHGCAIFSATGVIFLVSDDGRTGAPSRNNGRGYKLFHSLM